MATTATLFLSWLILAAQTFTPPTSPGPERFALRVVTSGLAGPWQMRLAPDGYIWVTERTAKRITRINPVDGARTIAITIPDVLQTHFQDGLLGMALHPGLLTDGRNDFVYVVMTYDADPGAATTPRMMVRRYTYDRASHQLSRPVDLLRGLPAGSDHVSGRLEFGRDQALYLTIGDQGFNQFGVFCQPIRAQELPTAADLKASNWDRYQGKILRIALDGSIPADNPVLDGVRSHIFSYGHRNAQGLAVAADGRIYASEHGPSVDDELNLIQAGKNYGWPYVAGARDDRMYTYANWSASKTVPCQTLKYDAIVTPPSVPQQKESEWSHPDFVAPLRTFFTVDAGYRFDVQGNATIAPSGIHVYSVANGIPGWSRSILITSLLRGVVYRVPLSANGTSATGPTLEYFRMKARFRDVLASADGRTIFVASDTGSEQNPGSILAFTYQATN